MTLTQDKVFGVLRWLLGGLAGWTLAQLHWTLDADTLAKLLEIAVGGLGSLIWSWLSKTHIPYIDTPAPVLQAAAAVAPK